MALPTFVAGGTTKSNAAAITDVAWPAGHQANDIGLLVIQTSAQAPGINPPSGWTAVPTASPQSTGVAATVGSVRIDAFYKVASSSAEPVVDIGDSGDHQVAVITVWRGVDTAAPFDVNAGAVAASSTNMSAPTVTTTGTDRLVVLIFGHAVDTTTNPVSTVANAALANITSRKTSTGTPGTGGGFAIYSGEKATAGAVGATTAVLGTASAQALMTLSLKAPAGGTAPFGGFYMATGVKQSAGATGASTGSLQTAQVQAMIAIALKPPTPVVANPPVLDAIPDLTVEVGDLLEFVFSATDVDGGVLTFTVLPGGTAVPAGLTVAALTGVMNWIPLPIHAGSWNITVRVTDAGGLTDEQAINITVTGSPTVISAYTGGLTSVT